MNKKQAEHHQITLHKGHLVYALVTVALIVLLYFFVDRQASMFFNKMRHTELYNTFFYMQYTVNMLVSIIPYAYLYLLVMLYFKRLYFFEEFIFAAATSILIASAMTSMLKHVFGRYWTETFVGGNLSFIQNKMFGFDFFHGDIQHASFPSGHTSVIFAAMTILWIMYPKYKWLAITWCTVVIVGLLGCNFHFPSDVVAGAFVGIISACLTLHITQQFARNLKQNKRED